MEKMPKPEEKKNEGFGRKIKTAMLAGASLLVSNIASVEAQAKEGGEFNSKEKTEHSQGVNIENGKKNLRKVFEMIAGNRMDKDGVDLLIHLGGPDGFYRLSPEFLKKLVASSDLKENKDQRISNIEINILKMRVIDEITKNAPKLSEDKLTSKLKEIRNSVLETKEQMK